MLPLDPLLRATAPAGPHLPTATLRQYAAGTLPAAAQHRVEAHTLACPRCADILDGLLQTPPATTDQALHQLQQRLRLRVQQAETARPALRRASHRWLVPQLAAAATLLFGLLAGGWYTWQQRHAAPASQPVATGAPIPGEVPATPAKPAAPATPATSAATMAASSSQLTKPTGRLSQLPLARRRSPHPAVAQPGGVPAAATAVLARADDSVKTVAQAPVALAAAPRPGAASSPAAAPAGADSLALDEQEAGRALSEVAVSSAPARKAAPPDAGRTRLSLMPDAPAVPPTPATGYPAWREKIRRSAAEFKPEEGQPALSGTVQLRVLIGADGKVQEIRVRHGLRDDYDEEAQRLVCEGPAWIPGIGGGRRAAQFVDVAVPF